MGTLKGGKGDIGGAGDVAGGCIHFFRAGLFAGDGWPSHAAGDAGVDTAGIFIAGSIALGTIALGHVDRNNRRLFAMAGRASATGLLHDAGRRVVCGASIYRSGSESARNIAACIGIFVLGSVLAVVLNNSGDAGEQINAQLGPMSYEFASLFSFPPENLLTLFVPYPLGDLLHTPYIGRWYIWETSVYVGIINLALAGIYWRKYRYGGGGVTLPLSAAIVILMLGSYTPVYYLLFKYLPGFAMFRDTGKFGMFWVLLLAVLAGEDGPGAESRHMPWLVVAVIGVGVLLFAARRNFPDIQFHWRAGGDVAGRSLSAAIHRHIPRVA